MYSLLLFLLLFLGKMRSHLMHKISLMEQKEWEGILALLVWGGREQVLCFLSGPG